MDVDGINPLSEQPIRDLDNDDVRGDGDDDNLRGTGSRGKADKNGSGDGDNPMIDPAALEAYQKIAPPRMRASGNTGVKGVIADAREAQIQEYNDEMMRRVQVMAQLRRMCVTVDPNQSNQPAEGEEDADELSVDSSELDELEKELLGDEGQEDDEFLKQYRRLRMTELQAAQVRSFGWLHTVTADQFVGCVDDEPASVTVLVHLYEPHIRACDNLNRCFRSLARRFPHVKFVALRASMTRSQGEAPWDDDTLPIILVYRGGETVSSFMKVTEPRVLGPSFDEDSVETFLRKNELL